MGDAPYEVYTIFFNVIHGPIDFGGGLEHSSSQYDIMPRWRSPIRPATFGDFHVSAVVARVLPSLEREAHPAGRDVAVRLPRGAVHAALVVVGGRHRLLR